MNLKRTLLLSIALFTSIFLCCKPSKICIGIVSDNTYCGERELACRIEHAAKNLGWETLLDEKRGWNLKKKKNLDWVLHTIPQHRQYNKYSHNYLALLHPVRYEELETTPAPFYEKYSGYLLTIAPGEDFEKFLQSKNKHFFSVPFYPTLQYVEYTKVPLNTVMTMIPVWGNRLTDEKFKHLYSLLSEGGFTKFYGINDHSEVVKEHYLGTLPFDGISVVSALQKHGISLIFHSDLHNLEKIPSSRIFEAAAASAVIISDANPFVTEHFGQSIFYVDSSLPAEELYRQIKNHVDAIYRDPEKALEMAKRAHQIFVDRFLMEDQLLNIMAMHQEVVEYERNRKRSIFLKPLLTFLSSVTGAISLTATQAIP